MEPKPKYNLRERCSIDGQNRFIDSSDSQNKFALRNTLSNFGRMKKNVHARVHLNPALNFAAQLFTFVQLEAFTDLLTLSHPFRPSN